MSRHNARAHGDAQVESLAASLERFDFTKPVLVDEDNVLIAGHGRLLAAKKRGLKELPAVRVADWTEEKKRAFSLADNRLAELSELDMAVIEATVQASPGIASFFAASDPVPGEAARKPKAGKASPSGRVLKVGKQSVEITTEELASLTKLLRYYAEKTSMRNGFWGWLLAGGPDA